MIFCRHCGVRTLIIDGDKTLFLGHLRRVHPRSR
jgi:hypothetical protein